MLTPDIRNQLDPLKSYLSCANVIYITLTDYSITLPPHSVITYHLYIEASFATGPNLCYACIILSEYVITKQELEAYLKEKKVLFSSYFKMKKIT